MADAPPRAYMRIFQPSAGAPPRFSGVENYNCIFQVEANLKYVLKDHPILTPSLPTSRREKR
jgi:hypothetical protein